MDITLTNFSKKYKVARFWDYFVKWQTICFLFFSFIFISWRLITLQYCSGFCHTLTWISHGFTCIPIPIPPPTSLSTRFLRVLPVHQPRALVSCIQSGLVICFTLDMQNRKRDTDTQNRILDSVGEGEGGRFRENSIESICFIMCFITVHQMPNSHFLLLSLVLLL